MFRRATSILVARAALFAMVFAALSPALAAGIFHGRSDVATLIRAFVLAIALTFPVAPMAATAHRHGPPLPSGVAGFDLYRDGKTLHLLVAEFGGDEKARVLSHRRSADGGATWNSPVQVNDSGMSVHDIVRGNDPQIAAFGERVVAVWTAKGSGYGGSGPLATAVSADAGRTWRRGSNPADDRSDAGHAYVDIVAGAHGFDLVWLDSRDGSQGLRHARSRDGLSTWSRNTTVQKSTCECCWNTLSVRGEALFTMVRGKGPRDMLLLQRASNGHWHRRSVVGKFDWDYAGCPHTGGGLSWSTSRKSGDTLHAVVWTGADGREGLHYLRSADFGRTWNPPHTIGSTEARRGDVASSEAGHVFVVWDQSDGRNRAVYVMKGRSHGVAWQKPERVSALAVDAVYPRVTATDAGFLVVWTESIAGGPARLAMKLLPN